MKKRTLEVLQVIAWVIGAIAIVLLLYGIINTLAS